MTTSDDKSINVEDKNLTISVIDTKDKTEIQIKEALLIFFQKTIEHFNLEIVN